MDWKRLADQLRSACTREVARGDGWSCLAPVEDPIDVRALLVECATEKDLDDWTPLHGDLREEHADPSGTSGVVHDHWIATDVIIWEWVGRNSSWHGTLGLFDAGDGRQYLARFLQDTPYQVLGCIVPKATRESFTAFFRDLFIENGSAYGVELLGSLPATTEIHRPDLLTRETITEVYHRWMDEAEASGQATWEDLAERLDEMDAEDGDELDEDADANESDEDDVLEEDHEGLIADYCESTVLLFDLDDD
jgi:hypothetical protein